MDSENNEELNKIYKLFEKFFTKTIIKRLLCAVLLAIGIDKQLISEKLGLSLKSIKKYDDLLHSEDYLKLAETVHSQRKSKLEDYKEVILTELEHRPYKTLREISVMIENLTGLKRSRYRISVFLKKIGIGL
jgi:transposase